MTDIRNELFSKADPGYRAFTAKLTPTVPPESIIGVRVPLLRAFARKLAKEEPETVCAFLAALPHAYYEENCLHAYLLAQMREFSACVQAVDAFLPYVDNWAVCDGLSPKVFCKHRAELLPWIDRWLCDGRTYHVRFAVDMLMAHYLDEDFDPRFPEKVAALPADAYYVSMAVAWYFATALAKQYDAVLPYLTGRRLDPVTHNRTIQKAVESYRIDERQKAFLRTLRQK